MTRECHTDRNSLTTSHVFDWARPSVVGNGSTNGSPGVYGGLEYNTCESIGSARAHRHKLSIALAFFRVSVRSVRLGVTNAQAHSLVGEA